MSGEDEFVARLARVERGVAKLEADIVTSRLLEELQVDVAALRRIAVEREGGAIVGLTAAFSSRLGEAIEGEELTRRVIGAMRAAVVLLGEAPSAESNLSDWCQREEEPLREIATELVPDGVAVDMSSKPIESLQLDDPVGSVGSGRAVEQTIRSESSGDASAAQLFDEPEFATLQSGGEVAPLVDAIESFDDAAAESVDVELIELFRAQVSSAASLWHDGVERCVGDAAVETTEPLRERAHAIKAAALVNQLSAAARVGRAMEAAIEGVQRRRKALSGAQAEALREAMDWLSSAARDDAATLRARLGGGSDDAALIARLEASMSAVIEARPVASTAAPTVVEVVDVEDAGGGAPAAATSVDSPREVASVAPVSQVVPTRADAAPVVSTFESDAPLDGTVADLFELFRQEIEGHTATLSDGLLQLEEQPGGTGGVDELMRAAHSLKGAARVMDLEPFVRLAHTMEDCFVAAQGGDIHLDGGGIDLLLRATDLLAAFGQIDGAGLRRLVVERGPEIDEMVVELGGVVRGETPSPASARPTDAAVTAAPTAVAPTEPPPMAPPPVPTAPPAGREDRGPRSPAVAAPPPAAHPASVSSAGVAGDNGRERAVRVTADALDRMVGLAGETLVEARWIEPYADSLLELKRVQGDAFDVFDGLRTQLRPLGRDDLMVTVEHLRREMARGRKLLLQRVEEIEDFQRRSLDISERLYRQALHSRMRPFADVARGLPRTVRDLAKTLGKEARVELSGEDTPVDRDILQRLEAPLNHLLRNAVDHGLESPAERIAAGKSERGVITVEVGHRAGMLNIVLRDDGRGVDMERVRRKVSERKLAPSEMVALMSDAELLEFLFLPGFSTAESITDISGRGVGLDVVQTMMQQIGGVLRAESHHGQGTSFILTAPITRAVMRTLIVEVAGEPLAFPLARIDRTVRVPRAAVEVVEGKQYFDFEGAAIGLVAAAQVLEWSRDAEADRDELAVVVIGSYENRFGVVVDGFVGERDLVMRPLDSRLGRVRDVNAAAILHDGSPVLIVDVDDLARSIDNLLSGRRLQRVSGSATEVEGRKRILVVDDSITVREVERGLLEANGYDVDVAVDGVDGWNAARVGNYDLIVSDVDMPRMTGIELVQKLKADPKLRSVPVMIVSYKDREEDRRRGLEAGADYYLAKSSFHDETMLTAVFDLIGP